MEILLIVLAVILLPIIWGILIYNRLVKNKNLVEEGWSGIDVQLKRRANLIPNLVETVKGYATHEQDILENVTKYRNQSLGASQPAEQGIAEGLLGAALGRLFAVVENYPDLKADKNFSNLHRALDELEDEIQMARRYYNGTVRDTNIAIEAFPSNIIANWFQFKKAEFFEIPDEGDRAVPKVSFD